MCKKLVLIGLIVVLLVGLASVVGLQYVRYRALDERLPENGVPIRVAITSPASQSQSPAGTALPVNVTANGLSPLLSLELWANGVLVGVQAGPANGISPMSATFAWVPSVPGDYTLIARAIDAKKQTAPSDAVAVTVGASQKRQPQGNIEPKKPGPEKGILIANGTESTEPDDAPIPPAVPLPPPPAPPSPSDSMATAEPFQPNVSSFVGQVFLSAPPVAPALVAKINGCAVKLEIHDQSNNEEGFFVYRQSPSSPAWKRIATLNGQSSSQWLIYSDSGVPSAGGYTVSYYVTAFNAKGESPSNIRSLNMPAANCPALKQVPTVSFSLNMLKYDGLADRVYCYQSFDDKHWSRVPAHDFFLKGADGFITNNQSAENILLKGLEGKASSLTLDCWGWEGAVLKSIGKLHQDGLDLQKEGTLTMKVDKLSATEKVLHHKEDDLLKAAGNPTILDLQMPYVVGQLGKGVADCQQKLPSQGQNGNENFFFCFTYFSNYTESTQPFLFWNVIDGFCGEYDDSIYYGGGSKTQCNKLSYYTDRVKANWGTMHYQVVVFSSPGASAQNFGSFTFDPLNPLEGKVITLPPLVNTACPSTIYYQAQLVYDAGPNDPDYPNTRLVGQGNDAPLAIECPPPPPPPSQPIEGSPTNWVYLDVSVYSLKLADVSDSGDYLEVYGSFSALSSLDAGDYSGAYYHEERLMASNPPSDCEGLGCPQLLKGGTYHHDDFRLCAQDYSTSVSAQGSNLPLKPSGDPMPCSPSDFKFDKNHMLLPVGAGDLVALNVLLMDLDSWPNSDDSVCVGTAFLGPYSLNDWKSTFKEPQTIKIVQGNNGSASCTVTWHVQVQNP